MKFNAKQTKSSLVAVLFAAVLGGCSSSNDSENPTPVTPPVDSASIFTYAVTVTNLTNAQPLSPILLVSHNDIKLWSVGESADDALELLAESGDNSMLMSKAGLLSTVSGGGIITPGMSEIIEITTTSEAAPMLSIISMLVNTNDAFTGKTGIDVSAMAVGDTKSMTTVAYDAGTEANSESMGTIPGPVDSGEGYNVLRDDVDFVSLHSGVVTMDDGLTASILTEAQKFDNPVMMISISRLQ